MADKAAEDGSLHKADDSGDRGDEYTKAGDYEHQAPGFKKPKSFRNILSFDVLIADELCDHHHRLRCTIFICLVDENR